MSPPSATLACGHTVEEVDSETLNKFGRLFLGQWKDVVRLQPHGWIVERGYIKIAEKLQNFKFRHDDVVAMSFSKCGTTWLQEMVWTMRNNPNLDHPDASDPLLMRCPHLEGDQFSHDGLFTSKSISLPIIKNLLKFVLKFWIVPGIKDGIMFDLAEAHTKPRTIKTHNAFSLLPKNTLDTCKVVYVYRNPMDNMLSAMHHYKLIKSVNFVGTQDDFVDLYVNDTLVFSPYGQHLREAWQRRHHPNLFMTSYERLKKDIHGELKRLDAFLGTKLSDQQIGNVIQKTSFKNMQKSDEYKLLPEFYNKDVGQREGLFIRQGKCGTWKDKITPEQKAKLDAWIKTNFTDHGITFEYE